MLSLNGQLVNNNSFRYDKLYVSAPSPEAKASIIAYHSATRIGPADELLEFTRSLRGYTARDIVQFVNKLSARYGPAMDLDRLRHGCLRTEFTPVHRIAPTGTNARSVRWSDIGGYADVKRQFRRAVELPMRAGRKPKSGLLLHGPSGCSKTMLTHALATECRLSMFEVTSANVMHSLVGQSEAALRDIIDKARAAQPSIVFFDDIDRVLPGRNVGGHTDSSVSDRLLNELMTSLNGANSSKNELVIFVAATNRPDNLDEVRAGHRHLLTDSPIID